MHSGSLNNSQCYGPSFPVQFFWKVPRNNKLRLVVTGALEVYRSYLDWHSKN